MKSLLILEDFTLSHIDVTPVVLKTVESCRGEVVKDALDEAKSKTGISAAIISDQEPELKIRYRFYCYIVLIVFQKSRDSSHLMISYCLLPCPSKVITPILLLVNALLI